LNDHATRKMASDNVGSGGQFGQISCFILLGDPLVADTKLETALDSLSELGSKLEQENTGPPKEVGEEESSEKTTPKKGG
jgi:hypothetical protein